MAEKELAVEKPDIYEKDEKDEDFNLTDSRINVFAPKEQKNIIFRVDCRLVLTLGFLYLISLMDRTNLGAAAIAGYALSQFLSQESGLNFDSRMTTQLGMNAKNNAYTIVSVVFFIPYMLFQPPATVLIREIGPRRFLAGIVVMWGAVMIVGLSFFNATNTIC